MESDSRSGNPRLLVLGAGPAQLGLLEAARARGLWLAVVDRDPGAPGFTFADRRCILSTEDEPAIERLVGALGIDGIIAPGTDWPVGVAARIAEHAGLPHPISPQTAVLATNKLRQRERLDEAGVPQPRSWVVGGDDALPGDLRPGRRQGTRPAGPEGLTLVESPAELGPAIEVARSAARNGLALVEELVDGPEVTVVGFSVDGVFTALTVTDRITAPPPAFGVALAHVWPSHVRGLTPDVAERAVAALGIANGPSYTQLRIGPDGPMVIEVAARLGGGHDAELVEAAVGVDLNGLAIAAALGEPLDRSRAGSAGRRGGDALPRRSARRPRAGRGARRASQARIYREPGFVFAPLRRGSDRAGAVLATGASREEAVARADAAAERIRFVTADAGALLQAN